MAEPKPPPNTEPNLHGASSAGRLMHGAVERRAAATSAAPRSTSPQVAAGLFRHGEVPEAAGPASNRHDRFIKLNRAEAIRNAHAWFEVNSGWAPPDDDTLGETNERAEAPSWCFRWRETRREDGSWSVRKLAAWSARGCSSKRAPTRATANLVRTALLSRCWTRATPPTARPIGIGPAAPRPAAKANPARE